MNCETWNVQESRAKLEEMLVEVDKLKMSRYYMSNRYKIE